MSHLLLKVKQYNGKFAYLKCSKFIKYMYITCNSVLIISVHMPALVFTSCENTYSLIFVTPHFTLLNKFVSLLQELALMCTR